MRRTHCVADQIAFFSVTFAWAVPKECFKMLVQHLVFELTSSAAYQCIFTGVRFNEEPHLFSLPCTKFS